MPICGAAIPTCVNGLGHYGDDDVALNNFNTNVAAIAL